MKEQSQQDIERMVQDSLDDELRAIEMKAKLENAKKEPGDEDWWYIPVIAETEPEGVKRYSYYEILAKIENEIRKKEHINIVLIPTIP